MIISDAYDAYLSCLSSETIYCIFSMVEADDIRIIESFILKSIYWLGKSFVEIYDSLETSLKEFNFD